MKREYEVRVVLNERQFNKVVIDPHYEIKHSKSINDDLILNLVSTLNGQTLEFDTMSDSGWEIYVYDPMYLNGKAYRLIFCIHPDEKNLGVINAFRR